MRQRLSGRLHFKSILVNDSDSGMEAPYLSPEGTVNYCSNVRFCASRVTLNEQGSGIHDILPRERNTRDSSMKILWHISDGLPQESIIITISHSCVLASI